MACHKIKRRLLFLLFIIIIESTIIFVIYSTINKKDSCHNSDLDHCCEVSFYELVKEEYKPSIVDELKPVIFRNMPYKFYYKDSDIEDLAKLLYGESRSFNKETEQACIVWVVLNRVEASGSSIHSIATNKDIFHGYNEDNPVLPHLENISIDVISRWNRELNGYDDVGRVIPKDYLWFSGFEGHTYFRNAYKNGVLWDYSIESPYET